VGHAHLHGLHGALAEGLLAYAGGLAARTAVVGRPPEVALALARGQRRDLTDQVGGETEGCETEDE
jgi:hypothetical protein